MHLYLLIGRSRFKGVFLWMRAESNAYLYLLIGRSRLEGLLMNEGKLIVLYFNGTFFSFPFLFGNSIHA